MVSTKKRTNFAVLNQNSKKMKLTEKEEELIYALRNYNKSYPNGYPELLWYAEGLFNELLEH